MILAILILIGILYLTVAVFTWSLCRAAADADQLIEEMWLIERAGQTVSVETVEKPGGEQ
jgi:type IV secretory pathway VirB3-like protein